MELIAKNVFLECVISIYLVRDPFVLKAITFQTSLLKKKYFKNNALKTKSLFLCTLKTTISVRLYFKSINLQYQVSLN